MEVYNYQFDSNVHIAKIPKKEIKRISVEVCQQPKETVSAFYKRQTDKPDLVVNFGLFGNNSSGLPCFGLISNHRTYAYDGLHIEGFGITDNEELLCGFQKERDWRDFCSAYPMLIRDGVNTDIKIAKELDYATRRTCLGYNRDCIYVICVDNPGMKFSELQRLGHNLGLQYMMNADGGGSTKMIAWGKTITTNWTNRAVDNVLTVRLKKPMLSNIKAGDKVRVVNNVIYGSNKTFGVWYNTYTVMSVSGDRAVIGVNGVITAAVNTINLEKV